MERIIILIILSSLINSCSYECGRSDGLRIRFIGFSQNEVKSFTIKKFEKATNFIRLIDSVIIDSLNAGFLVNNDTLIISSSTGKFRLRSDFDYKIELPILPTSFAVTDLYEPQTKQKKGFLSTKKIYCLNLITSGKINNQPASIESDILFIRK